MKQMSYDHRFVNMREAAVYLGQSYRWMQRNWVNLLRNGVIAYRVPKDSPNGHLMFKKASLDDYIESCRINGVNLDSLKV